jgi:uncharacterized protein (TIGR03382 family)
MGESIEKPGVEMQLQVHSEGSGVPLHQRLSKICASKISSSHLLRGVIYTLAVSVMAFVVPGPIPAPPWAQADVGGPGMAGSSTYDPATLIWTNNGGGGDIWGTADQFHFVYMPVTGDCTISARVTVQGNTDQWAKAGVMIRESTAAGSSYAFSATTPGNGDVFQCRTATGAGATGPGTATTGAVPFWVQVTRVGDLLTGYFSPDGVGWTSNANSATIPMAAGVLVGLAVTAHNNASLSNCSFDNLSILDGAGNALWPPPGPPTLSISTPLGFSPEIDLSWTPGTSTSPVTSYNILRGLSPGSETLYSTVAAPATTFRDTAVSFGVTYYYVVQAVVGTVTSANSNEVSGIPQSFPPGTTGTTDKGKCGCASAGVYGPSGPAALAAALGFLLLVRRRPASIRRANGNS